MCSACQSMIKMVKELEGLDIDDAQERDEAKRVYEEMEKALEDLKSDCQNLR